MLDLFPFFKKIKSKVRSVAKRLYLQLSTSTIQFANCRCFSGTALAVFMVICVATLVEAFSKSRNGIEDVEIQNNNNNNVVDLKSSKDSVLTRDIELAKPKHKRGRFFTESLKCSNFKCNLQADGKELFWPSLRSTTARKYCQ